MYEVPWTGVLNTGKTLQLSEILVGGLKETCTWVDKTEIGLLIDLLRVQISTWNCLRVWYWKCRSILHGIATLSTRQVCDLSYVLLNANVCDKVLSKMSKITNLVKNTLSKGLKTVQLTLTVFAKKGEQPNFFGVRGWLSLYSISGNINWLSSFKAKSPTRSTFLNAYHFRL